jgi:hypothetical protein
VASEPWKGLREATEYGSRCLAVDTWLNEMAMCQNLVPLVNIKIAGKWMFIPLKIVLIGIDPYPNAGKRLEHVEETWEDHGKTMRPYRRLLEHI